MPVIARMLASSVSVTIPNVVQDADGSGAIDAGELGAALKLLGVRATPSEVTANAGQFLFSVCLQQHPPAALEPKQATLPNTTPCYQQQRIRMWS